MLTRGTRYKLIAFVIIGLLVIAYTGIHFAHMGRYLGLRGYYVVHLELANSGGLFPNADVNYRGVSVGRVGALRLTASGVEADLNISDSAPPIPANLRAAVADLTAVGEQYVDLRPMTTAGPYLAGGSVIPERDTQLPLPITTVLGSVNTLATSLPLTSLRTLLNELGTGFYSEGSNLQALIDGQSNLVHAASSTTNQTTILIQDSQKVLATQVAETGALETFGRNATLLAQRLDQADSDLRRLFVQGPQAAAQLAGLLSESGPSLGVLIANLLTTSEINLTRGRALNELLSALPAAIAIGSTVINSKGATFGLALTFFNPLPCTAGYSGTVVRNGLDTSAAPPVNTSARCTSPASSGKNVRGSAHAPSGGGVPSPARAGLAKLLGISP